MEGADVQDFCSQRDRDCSAVVAGAVRFGRRLRQRAVEVQPEQAGGDRPPDASNAEERFCDHGIFLVLSEDNFAEAVI